jgi:hypothetical protein
MSTDGFACDSYTNVSLESEDAADDELVRVRGNESGEQRDEVSNECNFTLFNNLIKFSFSKDSFDDITNDNG